MINLSRLVAKGREKSATGSEPVSKAFETGCKPVAVEISPLVHAHQGPPRTNQAYLVLGKDIRAHGDEFLAGFDAVVLDRGSEMSV